MSSWTYLGTGPILRKKNPTTILHRAHSGFAVDGEMLKMRSRMPRGEIYESLESPADYP